MSANSPLSWFQICGFDESHLAAYHCPYADETFLVHREVADPLTQLVQAAAKDGLDLQIVSAYRGFSRQQSIWNRKWNGDLPCRDAGGQIVDLNAHGDTQKLWLILFWSAFPGLSRHHWGTDFDVFDGKAIASGHRVELLPREFRAGGPSQKLSEWLGQYARDHDFFRPYSPYAGGVAEEPWHISYAPVAQPVLEQALKDQQTLLATLSSHPELTAGFPEFEANFPAICDRFLRKINRP